MQPQEPLRQSTGTHCKHTFIYPELALKSSTKEVSHTLPRPSLSDVAYGVRAEVKHGDDVEHLEQAT